MQMPENRETSQIRYTEEAIWDQYKTYFPKAASKEPPLLVTIDNPKPSDLYPTIETLEFTPTTLKPTGEAFSSVFDALKKTADYPVLYHPEQDAILFNKNRSVKDEVLLSDLCAELTIAAVHFDSGYLPVISQQFSEFNGFMNGFGADVYTALSRVGFEVVDVDVREFFPPIGQSLILRDRFDPHINWNNALNYLRIIPASDQRAAHTRDLARIMPRLAGELLVKQYKGDIAQLARENPLLFELPASEIWEQYCVPILTEGKLSSQ